MTIRIGRVMARLLLVALYPLWLSLKLVWFLMGYRKPVYAGTIDGDPLAYTGDKPLLIAFWHEGLSFWDDTSAAVEQLRTEFGGRCEFAYVEVTGRDVLAAYNHPVVPALILRHRGAEVGRFVNVLAADEVRPSIVAIVGLSTESGPDLEPGGTADGGGM